MNDVLMPWAFALTRFSLIYSLKSNETLFSYFPLILTITFVPSAFYAYVWHILEGTSKAYIFFPTQKSSQPEMGLVSMAIF